LQDPILFSFVPKHQRIKIALLQGIIFSSCCF
jgi:hypothetical protein